MNIGAPPEGWSSSERCRNTGREAGFLLVDQVLENREGQVVTTGEDGIPYVVKEWFQGNECNTRSREDILKSLEAMAQLHTVMQMEREDGMPGTNLLEECRKHNRELRKTRKFVQKKKMKNPFEELLAASITSFLEAGEMMVRELENSGYEHFREEHSQAVCHGDCNQHNIIFSREGAGFMNFEHCTTTADRRSVPFYEKNPGKKQLGSGAWQADGGTVQPKTSTFRWGISKSETAAFLPVALLETGELLRGESESMDIQKEH